jgi:hypothetical protein
MTATRAPGVKAGEQFLEAVHGGVDAATRRDAARYRYLRERDLDTLRVGGIFVGITPDNVVVNGEDLDRSVDRAMSEEKREFCCGDPGDCMARECWRGRA